MALAKVERLVQQALTELRANRPIAAEQLLRQALDADPNYVPALGNLGAIVEQKGDVRAAAQLFQRICQLDPLNAQAYIRFGVCLGMLRMFPESVHVLREATQLEPTNAIGWSNLANAALELGQLEEAERAARTSIGLHPRDAKTLSTLSAIFITQSRFPEAHAAAQASIAIDPNFADAHYNLGRALRGQKLNTEALHAMEKAVELRPNYAEALGVLGTLWGACGEATRANQTLERALKLAPNNADLHLSVGLTFHKQGRVPEAITHYKKAAELNPQMWVAGSNWLLGMHDIDQPNPRTLFDEHVAWAKQHADPLTRASKFVPRNDRDENRRLRVAYISPDFRYHSVAHFLRPILELHNRTQFEIFCYSGVAAPDAWTNSFREMNVVWRESFRLSDPAFAEQLHADAIDIAVDLSGHTSGHRLMALARKPAPIQVTFLGYPDTTGMSAMDYRITDAIADPPGEADQLSVEKLMRLDPTAWCYTPPIGAPEVTLQRPPGPIRFGSFSVLAKITPRWVAVWCELLNRVPDSRILLKAFSVRDPSMQQQMVDLFTSHGISANRIDLIDRQPSPADHLATYNHVDIALDTFPYVGTTTTCEALYMGTPMITLAGQIHASRVGASLLSAAGLNDLIARDENEYIDIATKLANDAPRLAELRSSLRSRMQASPLMDAPRYTHGLEQAYRQMWHAWCRGSK